MNPRGKWVAATCVALVVAAIADAGPEIIESGSLLTGYDGPGPLIDLGLAAVVATVRWRFTPLVAAVLSAVFLLGGLNDADFADRLTTPGGVAFVAGWLQMLSFAVAVICGTAAVFRLSLTRGAKPALAGLAVGALGLVVQWIADPEKFGGFPPGIYVITACAALVVVTSGRWWAPIFAVLISLWIVLGGWAAGVLIPNFRSGDAGTVAGTAVMTLGLAFAAVTGILAMRAGRRAQAQVPAPPGPEPV